MKYLISTIADVNYTWIESEQKEEITYTHRTGPYAKENGLGLELTEYCLVDNCEHPNQITKYFEENLEYSDYCTLHAPYNEIFPHAIDPAISRVAYDRYDYSYKLCEKYNINKMIIHANYVNTLYFPEWFVSKQVEFWKEFLNNHKGQCQIVIENTMEYSPKEIIEIVKAINDERFKICLDVGHANIREGLSIYEWLEMCAPYLSHLHIHNNNGPLQSVTGSAGDLHNALGDGIINYEEFLKLAEEMTDRELTATIETINFKDSVSWLKEKSFI